MARRSRKNQRSVVGTLFVEFSALAGILGIAQPSVRDTFWRAIQPPAAAAPAANVPAANMPTDISSTAAGLSSNVYQSTPESSSIYFQPSASVPMQVDPRLHAEYAPAYTAQAVIVPAPRQQERWSSGGFRPMGSFQ